MVEFTTQCVGRIVFGHPKRANNKKYQDGPNKGQDVIKDGQKVPIWVFGIAFPKADFMAHVWPHMAAEIASGYPQGVPSRFAYKYKDGDSNDSKGKPYSLREGYAGCFILTVSTEAFSPPCFKFENGQYRQLDENEIKCGDYVVAGLNLKVNVPPGNSTHTPSLYVNPVAIELVGYGKEITSIQADPNALFGGRQHALPPGASATPISGSPGVQMPGMGGGQPQQPGMPPAGMPGAPAPGYAPQPNPGTYPGQPPAPGYAPQAPQPMPGGYAPPQPGQMPGAPYGAPAPGYAPQPGYPPQPAHDFVQNAGQQPPAPGYAPQPGYQPQPGQMPGAPGNGMPGMPPR